MSFMIHDTDTLTYSQKVKKFVRDLVFSVNEMGSPCNENGEYKNYQKNNRMDAI